MPNEIGLDVPVLRLAEAGFRIENVEADTAIIYLLDPDLRIVYCNKAWDQFASLNGGTGLNRRAILGMSVLDVIAGPLRPFYENAFGHAKEEDRPWEHDYECSSLASYRLFHMRVLPLADSYLLVENSLRFERPHGSERPVMPADSALYLSKDGMLTMCAHCRRTRRIGTTSAPVWDWVPSYLVEPPAPVSHGLCRNCHAYFYPLPTAIFDIFRLQPDGSELPAGKAESYTGALFDIEMLASRVPAKYVIRDRATGQRHVVNLARLEKSAYF
jgi:PAS domain-containing protein